MCSGHCTPARQRPSASWVLIYTSSEWVNNNNRSTTSEFRYSKSLQYVSLVLFNFILVFGFLIKLHFAESLRVLGARLYFK